MVTEVGVTILAVVWNAKLLPHLQDDFLSPENSHVLPASVLLLVSDQLTLKSGPRVFSSPCPVPDKCLAPFIQCHLHF